MALTNQAVPAPEHPTTGDRTESTHPQDYLTTEQVADLLMASPAEVEHRRLAGDGPPFELTTCTIKKVIYPSQLFWEWVERWTEANRPPIREDLDANEAEDGGEVV